MRSSQDNLRSLFDSRADVTFGLSNNPIVNLHGIGGFTIARLIRDLGIVFSLSALLFWR